MVQLFSIGPFTVHFFGVMIAIGIVAGLGLFIMETKRRGMNYSLLVDGVLYSIIGGLIGARLIYVLAYSPGYYLANPVEILFIHEGGLSVHGGLLGGLLVGWLFLKKHKLPLWETMDAAAPALILAQGISRIGCDVFGAPAANALPWAIEVSGELLHPAQAYEFLLNYLLFAYLWVRRVNTAYHGQVFLHYLVGYFLIRGIVEFTRINPVVYGPFSVSHLLSAVGVAIGLMMIWQRRKQKLLVGKKAAAKKAATKIEKTDILKTALATVILMVVSLVVYYLVQG